ncbi:MAG: hypothetical protein KF729_04780 [Sandaracinaceae bacterium]|nr:hypothetical protein [Sandaracinaceae bacterium]
MDAPASEGLIEPLRQRRFDEVRDALGAPGPEEPAPTARLRAALAVEGWAPLVDLTQAARRLTALEAPDAPDVTAQAVRALARAGARGAAARTLAAARERWPEQDALRLVEAQLRDGRLAAEDAEGAALEALLARGDVEGARAAARAFLARPEARSRTYALRTLADLARGAGDFAEAADAFAALAGDAPSAVDAELLRAAEALARWAAGDSAAAIEALRAIFERTGSGRGHDAHAHAIARDVLDALDRDPDARARGPRWRRLQAPPPPPRPGDRASGALAIAASILGFAAPEEAPRPTMAHARAALAAAGAHAVRAVATPAALEAALEQGVVVVLEEELATETGFTVVLGLEPVSQVLLLSDPRRGGAYLQTVGERAGRAALHGGGALFVAGTGAEGLARAAALAARGVSDDPRLEAIDRCDLDERGEPPPRARVDVLAQDAIALAPELPMGHRRLGESMLEQLRAGRLAGGRMERWVALTRTGFPDAEWALQIYAQALERWGRHAEAGIAWADAHARDPWDERNTYGMARACAWMGERDEAERLLRRTLSLRHGHAPALARLAEARLEAGDLDAAREASALAEDLAPTDREVLTVRASVLEAEDRFDDAIARLDAAREAHPDDAAVASRCLWRHSHAGRWAEAAAIADAMLARDPGEPLNWADAAAVAFGHGDAEGALELGLAGIERCGPARALVDELARALGTLLDETRRASVLSRLERLLASRAMALMDLAAELTRRRLDEDGVALALRVAEILSFDANGPWRAAQTILALPEVRGSYADEVRRLLEATIARAGRYPHPRAVLALTIVEEDPRAALELVRDADVHFDPAVVWIAQRRVQLAAGDDADAARTDERLRELAPDALLGAAGFYRNTGFADVAAELLARAIALAPEWPDPRVELARACLRVGALDDAHDAHEAARALGAPGDSLLAAQIAEGRRDWARLAELAAAEVARVTRRSAAGTYDAWPMRARLAAAKAALGADADDLARIRERAGRHPDALAALVAIERAAGLPRGPEDAAQLAALAPGAMITLERGGVRW